MALSRSTAPLWILLDLGLFFALTGLRPGVRILRNGGVYAAVAASAIGTSIVLNRLWELLYGPHFIVDPTPLGAALEAGWRELPGVLQQHVGVFGYLEVPMTPLAYVLWLCLATALVVVALLVGSRRERIVLLSALAVTLLLPVLLVAVIMRHTGWGLQGRYVMAFSVAAPLLAGEIVVRRRELLESLHVRTVVQAVAVAAGLVHVYALFFNARRFAVGVEGPAWFLGNDVWSPPGGWWPWVAITLAAGALLALAPLLDVRSPARLFARKLPR
jgi:hypothetical protein